MREGGRGKDTRDDEEKRHVVEICPNCPTAVPRLTVRIVVSKPVTKESRMILDGCACHCKNMIQRTGACHCCWLFSRQKTPLTRNPAPSVRNSAPSVRQHVVICPNCPYPVGFVTSIFNNSFTPSYICFNLLLDVLVNFTIFVRCVTWRGTFGPFPPGSLHQGTRKTGFLGTPLAERSRRS